MTTPVKGVEDGRDWVYLKQPRRGDLVHGLGGLSVVLEVHDRGRRLKVDAGTRGIEERERADTGHWIVTRAQLQDQDTNREKGSE